MKPHVVLQFGIAVLGLVLLLAEGRRRAGGAAPGPLVRGGIGLVALANLALLAFLVLDHLASPFENEVMEFTVLQHAARMLHGLPAYPVPGPDFVPLAYNPLFYVLAVPLLRVFGESLLPLRLLSVTALAGCLVVVFAAVRRRAGSAAWGLVAAGLFAAAYKAMDSYLDTAHSDAWMLFTALLGTWILERRRGAGGRIAGMLVLTASFWFKQHGALFALGGAVFVTGRDGWRRALPAWALLLLLGPGLYVLGGDALFGPAFHQVTWDVPRSWSRVDLALPGRVVGYLALWYALPAALAAVGWAREVRARGLRTDAWTFQLVPAALSAFMGALDAASSHNVFIPIGAWVLIVGTSTLARMARQAGRDARLEAALVFLCFALLAYNPRPLLIHPGARAEFRDLRRMVDSLPGTTYAPWIGRLPGARPLHPAAHVVAVEDWIGRRAKGNEPVLKVVLAPAIAPSGEAWVLANTRLESYACFAPLHGRYVLARDLGDRYRRLECLPRRWYQAWPRYLYRYRSGSEALAESPGPPPAGRSSPAGRRWSDGTARPQASATPPGARP